jgi:dTDP-4-amino-4,6-dideoxygalactose transaminase
MRGSPLIGLSAPYVTRLTTERFERLLAERVGAPHIGAVSSGTAGLTSV